MDAITIKIDTSLSVPGFTGRLATYEAHGNGPFERHHDDHYLTHILTPWMPDARFGRDEGPSRQPFVHAGRFQFLPRARSIQFRNAGEISQVAQAVFDPEVFARVTGSNEFEDAKVFRYADIRSRRIREPMIRLEQELRGPAFDSLILVEALGCQLMVEIARQFRRDRNTARAGGNLSDWQIKRIAEFVREYCGSGSSLTAATLAELCGISPGHLMRSFKRTTGETLHAFTSRTRVEKAIDLLNHSDMPLKRIAAETGFATQSHFSHSFHRVIGEQPGRYRARIRGGVQ